MGGEPAPPRVSDRYRYWTDPPPERSPRCTYWVKRIGDGWRGNRRVPGALGYDSAAEYLGVYIWEYINVIMPMLDRARPTTTEGEP